MESGLLMLARAGVLACIFLPQYTTSHHLRENWYGNWFYVVVAFHAALVLASTSSPRKYGPDLEVGARWLLLGATSFLAGQSAERWMLFLVVSEMYAVAFSASRLSYHRGHGGWGWIRMFGVGGSGQEHVLGAVQNAKRTAQREARQLALNVVQQAFEAMTVSSLEHSVTSPHKGQTPNPKAKNPSSSGQPAVFTDTSNPACTTRPGNYLTSKKWQSQIEGAVREAMSSVAPGHLLQIHSTALTSSGELVNMELSSGVTPCSFEVDLRCHLDGALWMEGAAQRFAARGGSVSLRAKVQLAEAERWRWRWGPSRRVPQATNLTLSNVRVALHAVHTGAAKDDTQMQHSMEARLCKVARAKLAARLGDTLTLRLGAGEPTPAHAAAACMRAGMGNMAVSVAGCDLCLLLRVALSSDKPHCAHPEVWSVRARVLADPNEGRGGGGGADLWQRGRLLDMKAGPRRAALTLLIASGKDCVEVQVFQGSSVAGAAMVGWWVGPASALLQAPDQSAIRFEGDVRLPLSGARQRGLVMTVSGRAVNLEAGSPSDLREVPAVGLRGLVGVVSGSVHAIRLSPWDSHASTSASKQRFLIVEVGIGGDVTTSEPISFQRLVLEPQQPQQGGDVPSRTHTMAASVTGCDAESSFLLPLNYVASGHELKLRLLQATTNSAVPPRCLGQARLPVPGESDSLVGMARMELTDGETHIGFCVLSLGVKRSSSVRISKTRFADGLNAASAAAAAGPASAGQMKTGTLYKLQAETQWLQSSSHANSPEDTGDWASGSGPTPATPPSRPTALFLPSPSDATPAKPHVGGEVFAGILKNSRSSPGSAPGSRRSQTRGDDADTDRVSPGAVADGLSIDCVRTYTNPHDGYTVYVFKCTSGFCTSGWEIRRRYRDFQLLHTRLGKAADEHPELVLPPKRFFGSSCDTVVEERRAGLQVYLNKLVSAFDPSSSGRGSDDGSPSADGSNNPSSIVAAFLQFPLI